MDNEKQERKHTLQIDMLGGLSMKYDQTPISFGRQYFSKYIQLFLMLILNREKGIAKEVLLENLYGQGERANLNNNLNNMIFRLRRQLQELGLPKSDDIVIKNGQCSYVSESEIKVDVQEFEHLIEKAGDELLETEKKRACLLAAVEMYQGELLPKIASETWVIMESMRYKRLYESALEQLGTILSRERSFQELYALYTRAVKMYPFEHWQEKQIECLIAMNQNKKAYQIYQETVQMYTDELGLPPSREDLRRFRNMGSKLFGYSESLELIQQELYERKEESGAYYCSFPSFIDSYRVMARMMERSGQSVFLLMCTLVDSNGIPLENHSKTGQKMEWLFESMKSGMRKGDIYTKYSVCQYLALLVGTNMEDCSCITSRIDHRYMELSKSGKQGIRYYVTSLAARSEKHSETCFQSDRAMWKEE